MILWESDNLFNKINQGKLSSVEKKIASCSYLLKYSMASFLCWRKQFSLFEDMSFTTHFSVLIASLKASTVASFVIF